VALAGAEGAYGVGGASVERFGGLGDAGSTDAGVEMIGAWCSSVDLRAGAASSPRLRTRSSTAAEGPVKAVRSGVEARNGAERTRRAWS